MTRATMTLAGLVLGGAAVLALGGSEPERHLPETPTATAQTGGGTLVVDLVDGASDTVLAEVSATLGAELSWLHPLAVDEALATAQVADLAVALERLAGSPWVEVAEPEVMLSAFGYPNDPDFDKQWHLRAMGAPAGWAHTPRGAGVVVAVIDTGVTAARDLDSDRVLQGASFVPGVASAADDNGHGTHVAGTIAQSTNNGIGVAGVAPQATILPVKVLSSGGTGTSAAIAAGIDYAVDEGADVINLSLGGGYSAVVHIAVTKARKAGVIVVAAAGNSGRRGVSWPGALSSTIGVGATGPQGESAPYSSYGEGVDIAAPGGDKRTAGGGVWQDTIGRQGHEIRELQGTSMAAPHVAGAAAVLLSTGRCGPSCVEDALIGTARGTAWDEHIGNGHLDLSAALSHTGDRWRSLRFALGALAAFFMASLAGARARFAVVAGVVGALSAGGLFFLDNLPGLGSSWLVALLSDGVLTWPATVFGAWASRVPVVYSAALPVLVALPLAGVRTLRAPLIGLCGGVTAVLVHAASTGAIEPWLMGSSWGAVWLVANAVIVGLLGVSLAGTEALDRKEHA